MFKYLIYKVGQFLANHLSLKAAYRLAVFLSDLQYFLSFRDRRAVRENLKIILATDADVSKETREVFRNFGKYLVEFFRMAKNIDQKYIEKNVRIENIHHLDDLLRRGKGGIILTAHIGNWELGGVLISMLGYPLVAIALPHKERPVNDLFNNQRESHGVIVVPTNVAIRRCIETLRKNGFVALVGDRDFGLHGEALDFFGKKALIPRGPATFSVKTGAPIIPAFLIRGDDDTFTFSFGEAMWPNGEGTEDEKILAFMKTYTVLIEKEIKKHPTQWLMFRRFWCP